ncbi:MAG: alpha-2-macroglobulin family protein [Candidatus Omnitrophica bacterium]|nr:alpha-2-macroglobulin family protein [Candidatus Omnitrophota bacterium]
MKNIHRQKWFWITLLFTTINIVGLMKIVNVLEGGGASKGSSIFRTINARVEMLTHLFQKTANNVQGVVNAITNEFTVTEINPVASGTDVSIIVKLTHSNLGNVDVKGYVDIKPEVKYFVDANYYEGLEIKGDFKPRQKYHVEILPGLKAEDGAVLKEGFSQDVVMPDYDPTIRFKVPGMYLGLNGSRIIPLEVTNLAKVKLSIRHLYDNNVVYFLNNSSDYWMPENIGIDLIEKEIPVRADINIPTEIQLDFKNLLPEKHQGLFYIKAEDPSDEAGSDSKIVLVTDIGILYKRGPKELLVWANSLKEASPVAGATVKVFTKTNQLIVEGKTDEKGLMHFKDVDFTKDHEPFVVTVSTDNDLSFLEIGSNVISETDFDVQGRPYLSAGYEGFIYSDRGVYRPAEKAHIRTIVRAQGVKTPESFPVIFEINRPDGRKFRDYNAVLNNFGTADVDIDFPNYALTGEYKILLKVPGNDTPIGEGKINVEEFMPDSLKVAAKISDKRFNREEAIPVEVNVQQNFGAPAAQRDVDVSYNLKAVKFEPKEYKGFSFSDDTRAFSFKREYIAIKKSDENGNASFEIKLGDLKLPPSALEMSIRITAEEIGGRGSSVYEDRTVDVYPYYLGLKSDFDGNVAVGQDAKFDYVALSPDGTKASAVEASADVCKVIWNSMVKKDEKGKWQWVTESREDCFDHRQLTLNDGAGSFAFIPKEAGDYVVRIKGAQNKSHAASMKVFVEGSGVYGWSRERPDRIDLAVDKKSYAEGETAKLTIKSPFVGKGLLTCATDKVFMSKTVDVGNSAQEELIPVTKDFSPNAYCSLTVIRPVVAEEQWASHRGYGLIPVVVNNDAHKTTVEVKAPESVRPHETVKVEIQTVHGKPMEFSVALVDDAILRLTGYKTPDAFDFFYGKRADGLSTSDIYALLMPEFNEKKATSDSSPSGDGAYNPKNFNPVNAKRVASVALWKSQLVTDSYGKAQAEFTVPEFNGKLKWVVVGAGDGDFTSESGEVKVVEPLVLNPFLPRFLAMNDEFIVPVSVSNMTKEAGNVIIGIEPSNGFIVIGDKTQSVLIEPNKEGVVNFKVKAPATPQKGEIKITATLGNEKSSSTTEISIRPPVSWQTVNGVVEIPSGSNKSFAVPSGWLKGTSRTKLIVSGMPTLKLSGGLNYLFKYPYGCIEQTTSSVFPLLYLRDLASTIDSKKYNPDTINSYVNAGIERALSMQTFWGGFAMWPGEKEEYPFGSVYATDFLVEASKAGYPVPQFAKILALNYLESLLSKKEEECPSELKSYAVYVLAKGGRVNASWIRRLQEKKDTMNAETRFFIAAALNIMGDRKAVQEIIGKGFPEEKIERNTTGMLSSYVRQNAVALSMTMDIEPQSPMVPVLVSRLEKAMTNGQWASTQENAQAMIALGKYAKYFTQENIEFNGTVKVGDVVLEFNSRDPLEISDIDLEGKSFDVSVMGKGTAYVYWTSEGVPTVEQAQEKDSGIKVRRSLLDRDGKSVDLKTIKQGETLVVDLAIEGAAGLNNIVVEDLLPAGFEIENPRLKTTEKTDEGTDDMVNLAHMDIRDDRIVLFLDCVKNVEHYRYIIRAVTKGDFVLPAVKAEEMYDPSIFSVSGQGRVKIGYEENLKKSSTTEN